MPEAPDVETAWTWLLERRPHTRGWFDDTLPPVAAAAHAQPVLRNFYPFHTHGTLKFLRQAPPWPQPQPSDDLPFVVLGEPPYSVHAAGYGSRLGEAPTAEDAIALVVANLPADLIGDGDATEHRG
ncbi:DUF6193 family natural product biosynthesis protein [Streptomyces kunmingensis]|uniref:DUF6193 family natural product biosynthesis protein n=1 Tax=Streptomyces kunmingensis TaxID=68225 RepID=A0ABU6CQK4_9ACTN|nr:DUF6193 family natural product biosynthesis protein [Streptomyces kunmingensis]MEB3967031.1 DUF6193 family natural product biosynthesis protein [Streptomyces kunmingensis]